MYSYLACAGLSVPGLALSALRPHSSVISTVQEFQPVVHRLRLFDLALGPDLPRADQLYPGNLRYSAVRIPTFLSLLIPAFSLSIQSTAPSGTASSRMQCSSTNLRS